MFDNRFQSYYSLISNTLQFTVGSTVKFQSYYSLISNGYIDPGFMGNITYFNPIIVLFLTCDFFNLNTTLVFQSYYSLISNYYLFLHSLNKLAISILL